MDAKTLDDWQKRLGVAASKLLARAEAADEWLDAKKQLDAFGHVVGLLTQIEGLRARGASPGPAAEPLLVPPVPPVPVVEP